MAIITIGDIVHDNGTIVNKTLHFSDQNRKKALKESEIINYVTLFFNSEKSSPKNVY